MSTEHLMEESMSGYQYEFRLRYFASIRTYIIKVKHGRDIYRVKLGSSYRSGSTQLEDKNNK